MTSASYRYRLPGAAWALEFSPEAIEAIRANVQKGWRSREAVGQLFTRDLTGDVITVELATTLKPKRAAWARVIFSPNDARRERATLFSQGLHAIGFWHSHPEAVPEPSAEDRALARDHAVAAMPPMTGIVFAIVGNGPLPTALKVWVDDGKSLLAASLDASVVPAA
jgi:proteasome lid subunit RPN8/RPN11